MEELFVLLIIAAAFALLIYSRQPGVIGARGEAKVVAQLSKQLDPSKYQQFHDLMLPVGNSTTQVDHIVLSEFGVFVIETKNMSGWIFGASNQSKWTQVVHRHKSQFQNPLRQNYRHIKAVEELLDLRRDQSHNVVVFVGSAVPKTTMPANVIWGRRSLTDYIISRKERLIEPSSLPELARRLSQTSLQTDKELRREHIKNLRMPKEAKSQQASSAGACPRCGAKMSRRTNKNTQQEFMGCSRFPKCRGTRPI